MTVEVAKGKFRPRTLRWAGLFIMIPPDHAGCNPTTPSGLVGYAAVSRRWEVGYVPVTTTNVDRGVFDKTYTFGKSTEYVGGIWCALRPLFPCLQG